MGGGKAEEKASGKVPCAGISCVQARTYIGAQWPDAHSQTSEQCLKTYRSAVPNWCDEESVCETWGPWVVREEVVSRNSLFGLRGFAWITRCNWVHLGAASTATGSRMACEVDALGFFIP
jgi:hypothetical protein